MDPRLKSIVDNFDSMKIGLDDSFQFHCTKCGKCCIDREDILLTPRDLFNAAAALNMMPSGRIPACRSSDSSPEAVSSAAHF